MEIKSVTLPPLRLRPITEVPMGHEPINALMCLVDETEGEDNIGAYLADEIYAWHSDAGWSGEISGRPLPRHARWWLPEHELIGAPGEVYRRDQRIKQIWEGA